VKIMACRVVCSSLSIRVKGPKPIADHRRFVISVPKRPVRPVGTARTAVPGVPDVYLML